jgi:hypothetical protein
VFYKTNKYFHMNKNETGYHAHARALSLSLCLSHARAQKLYKLYNFPIFKLRSTTEPALVSSATNHSGANPTIASYNASVVKTYSAVNSMARF